ncbi:MAG: hypothetical protein HY075_12630 [Deltaproteobacteria bacterium]|nr:hypothetical protein [Deltaproteobacteria bacterium]
MTCGVASGAAPTAPDRFEVVGPESHATIERSKAAFSYSERAFSKKIELRPCNREAVDAFFAELGRLRGSYRRVPEKTLAPGAPRLIVGRRTTVVAPGSELGHWLRSVSGFALATFTRAERDCAGGKDK